MNRVNIAEAKDEDCSEVSGLPAVPCQWTTSKHPHNGSSIATNSNFKHSQALKVSIQTTSQWSFISRHIFVRHNCTQRNQWTGWKPNFTVKRTALELGRAQELVWAVEASSGELLCPTLVRPTGFQPSTEQGESCFHCWPEFEQIYQ